MLLEGILTAATTCFRAEGKLFLHKLERNVERLSRTAISGLVMLGSTGEAVMLSDDESRLVLRHAVQAASVEKVMIAGIGRESLVETLRLAEYAAEQQYDAVLVRTPHFYRPQMNRTEMMNYYRMVADGSPLPVLLYSIPSYTLYELPVDIVGELAQHPNIIGIKDSSGKVERIAALVESAKSVPSRTVTVTPMFAAVTCRMSVSATEAGALPEAGFLSLDQLNAQMPGPVAHPPAGSAVIPSALKTRTKPVGFQILTGGTQTMLGSFHAGASGAILAMAAFAPQSCAEVYMAFKDQDRALELEKQQRLVDAASRIIGSLGIPGIKYACDLNGYYGGLPRLPLLPLTAQQQHETAALLAQIHN